ncbi:hypothetical protein QOZ80_1BG0067310 [Eleusine coracana subsp. coracana]|nr:hypothetical protein QOZ80_1BG0067310 [Eleusine coracana subsp. coracana]
MRCVYLAAPQAATRSILALVITYYSVTMKTGKNKRRRQHQQQQSGRPVLVTFYIARPARDDGAAATASGGHESPRRGSKQKVDGKSYNRRAELLEYSSQLRALARQTTPATQPAPPPRSRPRCRDTGTVGVVSDTGQRPAAENRLSLAGRRHERTSSQQKQIKQRCFGGGWSWKRMLVLVFPFNSSSHSNNSKRPRRGHDDGRRESNRNSNQKGWPAASLLGQQDQP